MVHAVDLAEPKILGGVWSGGLIRWDKERPVEIRVWLEVFWKVLHSVAVRNGSCGELRGRCA
jgi:hypothetical protein